MGNEHTHGEEMAGDHPAPARRPEEAHEAGAPPTHEAPLSPGGLAHLQRVAGNQAVSDLVAQRSGPVIQRDSYLYGSANTTPHIHSYPNGSHLKILVGTKIKRINLVQNGTRYSDGVAEAFQLAREAGNTTLVDAIKEAIRGVGPYGRPGSTQY
jgi:hypothetical protein